MLFICRHILYDINKDRKIMADNNQITIFVIENFAKNK